MLKNYRLFILAFSIFLVFSCGDNINVVPDNEPPSIFNISDLKIENYVNRLYIDLISREPTDIELKIHVDSLKAGNLDRVERLKIIKKLMTDTTASVNEGSYREAYFQNLYNLAKVRCIENVADPFIRQQRGIVKGGALRDSLNGKWEKYYQKLELIRRYDNLLLCQEYLLNGLISYREMFAVMIDNPIYDKINMNTFNFIRTTFDQLLWRLPTQQEYDNAFDMIEFNLNNTLFGQNAADKDGYISIVTSSWGMYEGMILWSFQNLLNRPPRPSEMYTILDEYSKTDDISTVISIILVTDEYANFE